MDWPRKWMALQRAIDAVPLILYFGCQRVGGQQCCHIAVMQITVQQHGVQILVVVATIQLRILKTEEGKVSM